MARFYKFALIASAFSALMSSCGQSDAEVGDPSVHKVVVQAGIETKSDVVYKSGESSGVDLSQISKPTLDQFMINVKSEKDNFNSTYEELSQGVELPIGKYDLLASCGENVAAGWNNSYYEGKSSFVLSNDQTQVDLSLQCGIGSALAYAVFDDKFRAAFSNFNVEFCTENNVKDPLVFNDGEKRIATFKPANKLWVVVNATKKSNGKMVRYGITPVMGVKAGELNVFHFTVQDGTVGFNVTVDNGYKVVEKKAMLDPDWADDRFTNMLMSFDATNTVLFVAGMKSSKTYDVVFATNVGLKNLYLSFDEAFAAELGFDNVDMLNLTPQEKEIVDNRIGAVLSVNTGNDGYRLSLSGCKDKLQMRAGGMTEFTFSIQSIDNIGRVENTSINIAMIEIKVNEFNNNRVWNRFAFIPAPYIVGVESSTMLELPFEYWIKEGSGDWKSLGVKNDKGEVLLDGLKANTLYQTKVTYEEFTLSECDFKTMPETKITNGNFEASSTFTYAGRESRVGAEFDDWVSNNAVTTMNRSSDQYYKSFPSVRLENGKNGKGALIQTIGWGNNAFYQHARKKVVFWFEDDWTRTKDQATAGRLSWKSENGATFDALPTKLTFFYKYTQRRSTSMIGRVEVYSDNELIGVGEFLSGANDNFASKKDIVIKYKNNAMSLQNGVIKKPSLIKVWFSSKSSAAGTGDLDDNDGSVRTTDKAPPVLVWDARHVGSELIIDDVEFVYPANSFNEYSFE